MSTWCEVIFIGRDEQENLELLQADSLYGAARMALDRVSKLWWYDPESPIVVKPLKPSAEYRVTAKQIRSWLQGKREKAL
jgi:hypothetical protein